MIDNKDTFSIGDLVRVKGTAIRRYGVITEIFSTGVGSDEVTITWLYNSWLDDDSRLGRASKGKEPLRRYLTFYLEKIEIIEDDRYETET